LFLTGFLYWLKQWLQQKKPKEGLFFKTLGACSVFFLMIFSTQWGLHYLYDKTQGPSIKGHKNYDHPPDAIDAKNDVPEPKPATNADEVVLDYDLIPAD